MDIKDGDDAWKWLRNSPQTGLSHQDLVDRAAVADGMARYAHAIDARDFESYRSLFADRVHVDFSAINGQPAGPQNADAFVAGIESAMSRFSITQHMIANHLVRLDDAPIGQRALGAHCVCSLLATHLLPTQGASANGLEAGGRYTLHVTRSDPDSQWRIDRFAITVLWRRDI